MCNSICKSVWEDSNVIFFAWGFQVRFEFTTISCNYGSTESVNDCAAKSRITVCWVSHSKGKDCNPKNNETNKSIAEIVIMRTELFVFQIISIHFTISNIVQNFRRLQNFPTNEGDYSDPPRRVAVVWSNCLGQEGTK